MLRVYESYNFARSLRTMDLQYAGESSSKTSGNHLLDQSQSYGGTICYIKIFKMPCDQIIISLPILNSSFLHCLADGKKEV